MVLSLPIDSPIIAAELAYTKANLSELLDYIGFMTCNVGQYLPVDDNPVVDVERIVHLRMIAQQGRRRGRGRGRFIPPQGIEFIVTTQEGHTLHLTGYCQPEVEECHLDLQHGKEILRKFHAHDGHKNPKGRNYPTTRVHMHFPSVKYPLIEKSSSYAYSIDNDGYFNDVVDCLEYFCSELGMDMDTWQPFLIREF
jgi:hypothetical protein